MPDFRISLVNPRNTTGFAEKIAPYEHLGLGYLAAVLRKNNYPVQIIDADCLKLKEQEIIEHVLDFNPDFVGLTSTWASMENAMNLATILKSRKPELSISLGGYTATFSDKEILGDYHQIDYIIRGEGEITLLKLVKYLCNSQPIDELLGITFRDKDNKIVQNPIEPYIKDLDTIPFPARDIFEEILQTEALYILNMITSRGCYGNCSFCAIAAFSRLCKGTPAWRGRSVENVMNELELLLNKYPEIHFVNFADNNFFGPGKAGKQRVKELAQAIIDRNLEIEWHTSARPDNFSSEDRELLKLLKASGLGILFIGIESGVQSQLNLFNKKITVAQNKLVVRLMQKYNIPIQWGFIMFNPYLTFEELIANVEFFSELNYYAIPKLTMQLRAFPGTQLYYKLKQDGLLREDFSYKAVFNYHYLDKKVELVMRILTDTTNHLYPENAILQNAEEMTQKILERVIRIGAFYSKEELDEFILKKNEIYNLIAEINSLNTQYFREIIKITENMQISEELPSYIFSVIQKMEKHIFLIQEKTQILDEKFKEFVIGLNNYLERI
ncbi:MAG: B12-binding domain-containing radical SAM protein [Candidatus Helarchaeota archaeon]